MTEMEIRKQIFDTVKHDYETTNTFGWQGLGSWDENNHSYGFSVSGKNTTYYHKGLNLERKCKTIDIYNEQKGEAMQKDFGKEGSMVYKSPSNKLSLKFLKDVKKERYCSHDAKGNVKEYCGKEVDELINQKAEKEAEKFLSKAEELEEFFRMKGEEVKAEAESKKCQEEIKGKNQNEGGDGMKPSKVYTKAEEKAFLKSMLTGKGAEKAGRRELKSLGKVLGLVIDKISIVNIPREGVENWKREYKKEMKALRKENDLKEMELI